VTQVNNKSLKKLKSINSNSDSSPQDQGLGLELPQEQKTKSWSWSWQKSLENFKTLPAMTIKYFDSSLLIMESNNNYVIMVTIDWHALHTLPHLITLICWNISWCMKSLGLKKPWSQSWKKSQSCSWKKSFLHH